ncbi:MAG TPA: biopolymer transporter ExbD [Bacteroidota bacterium]|nr:biopolymer transporter ExbD [Bacteroidota bacterium]
MKLKTEHKLLTIFSFSSLTDIVLLLLIFFLLSSSFVIQPGIKVQLPKAAAAEADDRRDIILTLTDQGLLFLNNDRVTVETLGARLSSLLEASKEKSIIINADRAVSLQSAVQVMDIAKAVGATRFLIATQPALE